MDFVLKYVKAYDYERMCKTVKSTNEKNSSLSASKCLVMFFSSPKSMYE